MPINSNIPLQVQGIDPNGFTNALAAGLKMRELQNASERLANKEDAAIAKSNALSKFGMSDRGPEALRTLYQEAPDAGPGVEKNIREAENHEANTKKAKIEWAKANSGLLKEGAAMVLANPTRENATMVLDNIEQAHGGDMTAAREQLRTSPDQQISNLARGWGLNAQQIEKLAQDERKASQPDWVMTDDGWVDKKALGGGEQPGPVSVPPAAQAPDRAPTVVPGGELPPADDIETEVQYRAGKGPAPTGNVDYEGLSDEGLDELVQASLASRKPAALTPPTAIAVPGQPPTAQPDPMRGQPMTRNQRQDAKDQRQAAKDGEAQHIAQETLKLRQADHAARERARIEKSQIQSGQRLTASDASKAQQKLVRIEDAQRQLALVRANWEGRKDEKGNQVAKGVKNSMGAGPFANLYAPGWAYAAGQKFDKSVESFMASKTAILRIPGIGSQSNLDVGLDREDIPARGDQEETTEQQIKAYEDQLNHMEASYRALLAGPAGVDGPADTTGAPVTATAVAPQTEFDSMPMPADLPGKRVRSPDGSVYRSNGGQWVRE